MIGTGLLKSLGVTARNLVRPKFTIEYPNRYVGVLSAAKYYEISPIRLLRMHPKEFALALMFRFTVPVKLTQSSRYRGNEFTWYENRCTGCAACAKYCPLGIIEIVTHPGGFDSLEGESYAIDVFDIDIGRCMFCGLCVEACPYDALHMGTKFERGKYQRADLVIDKHELNASPKQPSSWFRPQMEAQDYDPYKDEARSWQQVGRHEMPDPDTLKQRWVDKR